MKNLLMVFLLAAALSCSSDDEESTNCAMARERLKSYQDEQAVFQQMRKEGKAFTEEQISRSVYQLPGLISQAIYSINRECK